VSVGGDTALVEEIIEAANDDLLRVGPAVLLAVGIVLVVFLRALVAPLYLVALAALGPLSAVGLAVVVFQGLLGLPELTYFVPIVAVVLLVSLGSDYNIFLVGRIWDEARERPFPQAVVAGATGAAHAISAAGIVLAASFAALALVPIWSFQQLAFVLAAGLLIDAFLVRTVLAPAVIALVGERSGWPGRRLRSGRHPVVTGAGRPEAVGTPG
jgi:RND superfamily putative drug exporter